MPVEEPFCGGGPLNAHCCVGHASGWSVQTTAAADNNRIARATGASIVHRPEEIRESDIGTRAGLFDVRKIGDEFFTFIVDCKVLLSADLPCWITHPGRPEQRCPWPPCMHSHTSCC